MTRPPISADTQAPAFGRVEGDGRAALADLKPDDPRRDPAYPFNQEKM